MDPTMSLPSLQLSDLLGMGGLALVIALLIELVKRTGDLPDATVKRFGGLFAVIVGVALRVLAAWVLDALGGKQDAAQAVLTGFLAGIVAAWGYDLAGSQVGALVARIGQAPDARMGPASPATETTPGAEGAPPT